MLVLDSYQDKNNWDKSWLVFYEALLNILQMFYMQTAE